MTLKAELIEAMARASWETTRESWEEGREWERDNFRRDTKIQLTALLTALPTLGWQLVPVVADDGMIEAADNISEGDRSGLSVFGIDYWDAMLAAAPKFGGGDAG